MKCQVSDALFSAVLFDMDNTLFDLVGAKMKACIAITSYLGRGDPSSLFSYFLRPGRGFEDPFNIWDFMQDQACNSEEMYAKACTLYHEVKLEHIAAYPGVRETLSAIRSAGLMTALVTDAHTTDALARLEKTRLDTLFDRIVTFDQTGLKKPSTFPFLFALEQLGVSPSRALLIGDSPRRDIAPGCLLGMTTVYARYGDRFPDTRENGGAHYSIDDIRELLDILSIRHPGKEICTDSNRR